MMPHWSPWQFTRSEFLKYGYSCQPLSLYASGFPSMPHTSNYLLRSLYDLEAIRARTVDILASKLWAQLLAEAWHAKFVSYKKVK